MNIVISIKNSVAIYVYKYVSDTAVCQTYLKDVYLVYLDDVITMCYFIHHYAVTAPQVITSALYW